MLRRPSRWKLAFLLTALAVSLSACSDGDAPSVPEPSTAADVATDATSGDSTALPDAPPAQDTAPDALDDVERSGPDTTSGPSDITQAPDDGAVDVPTELPPSMDASGADLPEDTTAEPGPITVLFIGNSYTFGNQLPDLVQEWAQEIGLDLSTEMIAKGGALLEQHAADPETLATIAEMAPTYVVLQGQSYVPLVAPFTFYTGVAPLAQAAHAAGSTPVLFETWARQEGHSMYSSELDGYDPTSMQATLREVYKKAAADNDAIYAPVGDAWEVSLGVNPELTLHSGDGSHAAMTGSYLAAAVFVGLLGDVEISSDANSWIAKGLDEIDGGLLREAAQEVLDAP
jgi:hypothetical protein